MDNFPRLFQEFGRHGNHAVVKTRAYGQNHIGIVHGQVGLVCAVHAEHAEEAAVGSGIAAQTHQRAGAGNVQKLYQFGELFGRITQNHAAAEIHQRAFGRRQHLHRFFNLTDVAVRNRLVGTDKNIFLRIAELRKRLRSIFGDVHHHRAGAAALRDLKRLFDGGRDFVHLGNQEIVLHARAGNAHHINFLKCIRAHRGRRHLAGNYHQRDGIAVGRGNAGDGVGGARAGSHQRHAHLAAHACIGIGGMHRCLLVAHQDMLEFVELVESVVDFQNRAAGIAEHVFHVLGLKTLHQYLCA